MAKKRKVPVVEVLRKKAGITQEKLSEELGITDHTYRNWIKGRNPPTFYMWQIKKLCSLLGCQIDDLPDDFSQMSEDEN